MNYVVFDLFGKEHKNYTHDELIGRKLMDLVNIPERNLCYYNIIYEGKRISLKEINKYADKNIESISALNSDYTCDVIIV